MRCTFSAVFYFKPDLIQRCAIQKEIHPATFPHWKPQKDSMKGGGTTEKMKNKQAFFFFHRMFQKAKDRDYQQA